MSEKGNRKERELYEDIGKRMLLRRKDLHYTQEQMAEILGISTGFYGMIERGEKAPSIGKLVLIHEKLGIDITYLLTGEKEKNPYALLVEGCPEGKRHNFEQLIRYALDLAQ